MDFIKPLDPPVRAQVRSGFAVPSFSQCVEELVTNSIDAKASHIICEFNTENLYCKVTDDGIGFTEEDISKAGTRYSTSKCLTLRDVHGNLRYYGYRGEALASIAELSKEMEIVSRGHQCKVQYTKRIVCPAQENRISRATLQNSLMPAETRVSFRGLFHELPVRRLGINRTLEAENIVMRVKRLCLVNPKISFSVVNASVSNLDFHVSKHEHSLERFEHIFEDFEGSHNLKRISSSGHFNDVRFAVDGAFSTVGHESKVLQFIYINGRAVMKTRIHSAVNSLLKKSEISCRLVSVENATSPEKSNQKHSMKRTYGVYFLNISCAYDEYDITFEPGKTLVEFRNWDCVLNSVLSVVNDFLRKNGLFLTLETHSTSLLKADLLKSKVTHRGCASELLTDNCVIGKFAHGEVNPKCKPPTQDITAENVSNSRTSEKENASMQQKQHSNWTSVFDKITGKAIFVNLSTGMTTRMNPFQDTERPEYFTSKAHSNAVGPQYVKEFVPRSKKDREIKTGGDKSIGVLKEKWTNPAVPVKANALAKTDPRALSTLFQSSKTPVVYTTDMFENIKVIGQVDRKFIACSFESNLTYFKGNQQKSIILFDQHAAHERVRLERLESQLRKEDKIESEKLEKKMHIRLTASEIRIMNEIKSTFRKHGLDFDEENTKLGVNILAVPQLFLSKTSKTGDDNRQAGELRSLMQRFVKDEIQVYRETGRGSAIIPRCISEILCSQACHGAIRFGDSLSIEECQKVISDLSRCQLPFQCAHGRPSLTSVFYNIPESSGKPNLGKIAAPMHS